MTTGNSVLINGSTATAGVATLDNARRVIITSAGNDSGITFALTGTNWSGEPISETITGANAGVAASVLDYKTVTSIKPSAGTASTITVGTNGVSSSPWVRFDEYSPSVANVQTVVTGTVSYSCEWSNDDPNLAVNPIAVSAMAWDTTQSPFIAASGSGFGILPAVPLWARLTLLSTGGTTAFVRGTFVQHSAPTGAK